MQKPYWLNKKLDFSACRKMKETLHCFDVHTVCEEAACPNMSDCFSAGTATFLILGNICTRRCLFCAVSKGSPGAPDPNQAQQLLEAVKALSLRYVVITSPTRDDLEDGGAQDFFQAVKSIKDFDRTIKVEILIPDFSGSRQAIAKAAFCGADVISHNLETTPSLYVKVRPGADYVRSLEVLRQVKAINREVFTKSGLMLGLGEETKDVLGVLKDLKDAGCDFLTLGQYLAPSLKHYPVKRFPSPEEFVYYANQAYKLGFKRVQSSPYSRSSFLAHNFLADNSR